MFTIIIGFHVHRIKHDVTFEFCAWTGPILTHLDPSPSPNQPKSPFIEFLSFKGLFTNYVLLLGAACKETQKSHLKPAMPKRFPISSSFIPLRAFPLPPLLLLLLFFLLKPSREKHACWIKEEITHLHIFFTSP